MFLVPEFILELSSAWVQSRCARLEFSFPATRLRRREVMMALRNFQRRIIPHFFDLFLLPLGAAHGPVARPPWPPSSSPKASHHPLQP